MDESNEWFDLYEDCLDEEEEDRSLDPAFGSWQDYYRYKFG